jgi:small subunit ribosomal protein S5
MRTIASRLARNTPIAFRNVDSLLEQGLSGCSPISVLVTKLISLRPLQNQSAAFSAYKKPPSEDEVDDAEDLKAAARKGHLPRVNHSLLRNKVSDGIDVSLAANDESTSPKQRQDKIRDLLRTMNEGKDDITASGAAFRFLDTFFTSPEKGNGSGNGKQNNSTQAALPVAEQLAALGLSPDDLDADSDEETSASAFDISTPAALDTTQEGELLAELRGLRRGSQRVVLQKLLQGGMLRADPAAMAEWKEIQAASKAPEGFRMKVVDVNRTCKGTRSGGLYRFSAMVVVGNGEGVLGWGQGKAAEVNEAVRKAYQRACRNLYPIPRFNRHTIPEPATAKFGKVKVVMYPKSSGRGIVASSLVSDICKLAGIHDIGVKIHGSRNPRNTVKCLFEAFDGMKTHEEILGGAVDNGKKVMVAVPAGRFGRLAV